MCVCERDRQRHRDKETEREIERETEREEKSEGGREMEGEMPSLKRHHWMCRCCYMPRRCHITVLGMFFPYCPVILSPL